jgi:hypothetical protein
MLACSSGKSTVNHHQTRITSQSKRMKKLLLKLNFISQIPIATRERWNRKLEEYARASSYAIHR